MTGSQVSSAKRRFVNPCYTMRTVTKATKLLNCLCGSVGEPKYSCSEDGFARLGCPGNSQTFVGFFLR